MTDEDRLIDWYLLQQELQHEKYLEEEEQAKRLWEELTDE